MLYKCANEACHTPFLRLREGKLFQVETEYFAERQSAQPGRGNRPWHRVEHYWLCDACAPYVTLAFDKQRGVITVPLPNQSGKKVVRLVSMDAAGAVGELKQECSQQSLHEVLK